jgi:hypothetical protein
VVSDKEARDAASPAEVKEVINLSLSKQDQQLDKLINIVRQTKALNEDIGQSLREQDPKLSRLNNRMENADYTMKKMTKQMDRL